MTNFSQIGIHDTVAGCLQSPTSDPFVFVRRPGSGRRKQTHPFASAVHSELPSPLCMFLHALGSHNKIAQAKKIRKMPGKKAAARRTYFKKCKSELVGPCAHCQVTHSPQWRKGPMGILCNACGIRFKRTGTFDKASQTSKLEKVTSGQKEVKTAEVLGGLQVEQCPMGLGDPCVNLAWCSPSHASPAVSSPSTEPLMEEEPFLQWGCRRQRSRSDEPQGSVDRLTKRLKTPESDCSNQSTRLGLSLVPDGQEQVQTWEVPKLVRPRMATSQRATRFKKEVPSHWEANVERPVQDVLFGLSYWTAQQQ